MIITRGVKYFLIIFILSLGLNYANAQNTIHFFVKEKSEDPLPGVSILIEGTLRGTVTDTTGQATLDNIQDGEVSIRISYMGYEDQKITLIFPDDNRKTIPVVLEPSGELLEEIIISTVRSSRTIEDIPTRIEVITSDELGEKAAMNSSNIGMLLSETTGVRVQFTSLSSGNLSIRIQGLDGRYTQILKDGFPLYGGFAGGLSIMQIPPLDLRQVELIKGSNSTLYGGGAIAGLVNLITIKPGKEPALSLMIDQTSALGTTGNLFYAQKYGETGLTVYGAADHQTAYDPDDDGFSNLPKSHTISINPRFFWYINPRTELSLGLNTTFDKRTGGDMKVIKGYPDEEHVFTEENKSNRYATMLDFSSHKRRYDFSFKNSFNFFDRKVIIPGYLFSGNQLASFNEILFNMDREESDWQVGVNYYSEIFRETHADSIPVRDYSHHTLGTFIQNTTKVSELLTLESGLRTDYNIDYGPFILPRISLLIKPSPKLTSRIGGAFGYKLPTLFTEDAEKLYFRGIVPINPADTDPERSMGGNADVNFKTSTPGGFIFSVNQMFFITRLKNSLVLRENSLNHGYFYENADGDILSSGFETNIKFTYSDFTFYVNYAFIHTQLKYDNIFHQKPLTPKHNAGFLLMYESEGKWTAGYELYYTGNQFDEMYELKPHYWVMGFMAMRKVGKFSLYVNFENFNNTIQSDFEPLVLPPSENPSFPDIWAPVEGFVFNAGVKYQIL
jgi:outer membrane receptor for ferrienterochelin and colicins